jgi:putative transposase
LILSETGQAACSTRRCGQEASDNGQEQLRRSAIVEPKRKQRTDCPACGSTAIRERPERTAQGYRRFHCQCDKQFNERSADVLNNAQYPSDVIALVVLWRLRYKLSLRDLAEMFLTRGFIFTYEAVREWEAKLTPALTEHLRRKRKGRVATAGTSMRVCRSKRRERWGQVPRNRLAGAGCKPP